MLLKTRLRLLVVALAGGVAVTLSAVYLQGLLTSEFAHVHERAQVTAQQVKTFVFDLIRSRDPGDSRSADESIREWTRILATARGLPEFLEATTANSAIVMDILVTAEDGRMLAASNPARAATASAPLENFADWDKRSVWVKLGDIVSRGRDYEVRVPLGIGDRRLFTIRVIVSTVLIRDAVLPRIYRMAIASMICLVLAAVAAVVVSKIALQPIARLGEAIDRITAGEGSKPAPPEPADTELAQVRSKLDLLDQRFRGAREDVTQLRGNIGQMLDRLEDAVLLFDTDGRLLMAGKAAERYLGLSRWEMLGRRLEELFPPDAAFGALVQAATELRRPIRNHAATLGSGARVALGVEVLEDFETRRPVGTLVTIRDAETRRQIESRLEVSERLAAISRITGSVAHEIKNPLNAMAVHLEILKSSLAGEGADEPASIGVIAREMARLDRVVKTFLDFTRPVELNTIEVDLGRLAREIVALVRPEAERHGVAVELDQQIDAPIVNGDRDLLQQAVLNVVTNGVEAMPGGGRLTLRLFQNDNGVTLEVADQGPGIPPEARARIFHLYYTTKEKGSGIGLATTFRIVQLHNATIDVASEVGGGATFIFRFPAIVQPSAERPADSGVEPQPA